MVVETVVRFTSSVSTVSTRDLGAYRASFSPLLRTEVLVGEDVVVDLVIVELNVAAPLIVAVLLNVLAAVNVFAVFVLAVFPKVVLIPLTVLLSVETVVESDLGA